MAFLQVEGPRQQRPVLNGWSLGGAVVAHAAAELGSEIAGLVLTGGATPRYTAADDWPYGGTVVDVEKILVDLGFDRASTLKKLARMVCTKPVGEDIISWLWIQL